MAWNGTIKRNTYWYKYMHCGAIYNIGVAQFISYLINPERTENWHELLQTLNTEHIVQQTMPTTNGPQCTLHIYCYIVDNNSIRWLPHSKCSVVMKFEPPLSITLCGLGTSFIETFITAQKLNEQVFCHCFAIILKRFESKNIILLI